MQVLKDIWEASKNDPINLDNLHIKLTEEIGELAVAHLMDNQSKGTKKSKEKITENYLEEICDSIIILIAIARKRGFDIDEITTMLNTKLEKYTKRCNK